MSRKVMFCLLLCVLLTCTASVGKPTTPPKKIGDYATYKTYIMIHAPVVDCPKNYRRVKGVCKEMFT